MASPIEMDRLGGLRSSPHRETQELGSRLDALVEKVIESLSFSAGAEVDRGIIRSRPGATEQGDDSDSR